MLRNCTSVFVNVNEEQKFWNFLDKQKHSSNLRQELLKETKDSEEFVDNEYENGQTSILFLLRDALARRCFAERGKNELCQRLVGADKV